MKKDITELFYSVDEFASGLEKEAACYQLSRNRKGLVVPEGFLNFQGVR